MAEEFARQAAQECAAQRPDQQTRRPADQAQQDARTRAGCRPHAAVPGLFHMLLALVVDLDHRPGCDFVVLRVPCLLQQVDNLFCPVLAGKLERNEVIDF